MDAGEMGEKLARDPVIAAFRRRGKCVLDFTPQNRFTALLFAGIIVALSHFEALFLNASFLSTRISNEFLPKEKPWQLLPGLEPTLHLQHSRQMGEIPRAHKKLPDRQTP